MAKLNCDCGRELTGSAFPQVCISCGKVTHGKAMDWRTLPVLSPFDYVEQPVSSLLARLEEAKTSAPADPVNHPSHYVSHPSKVECIQITEHMGFCLGNAIKYIWRADLKADAIEDLKKARWYLDREIAKREAKP
jgi:hypothetical protein